MLEKADQNCEQNQPIHLTVPTLAAYMFEAVKFSNASYLCSAAARSLLNSLIAMADANSRPARRPHPHTTLTGALVSFMVRFSPEQSEELHSPFSIEQGPLTL